MARQFISMTRIRIEGLLAAFPKLMSGGRNTQHTFIETESVRCSKKITDTRVNEESGSKV